MRFSVVGHLSVPVLVLATAASCYDDSIYEDLVDHQNGLTDATGETAGSSSTSSISSASGSSDTSDTNSSAGSGLESSGGETFDLGDDPDPQGAQPEILKFTATPGKLDAAGPIIFDLEVSDDVEIIELRRVDGGSEVALVLDELTPDDFPLYHAIVSAADNGEHVYRAIARNGEGKETRAELEVDVALPGTGLEIWSWESNHAESKALGIVPLDGGAVIAGYIVEEGEPRPRITCLSNTGKVLWDIPPVGGRGYASALTIRPSGDIIVVGNSYKDGGFAEQAMWMRRISPDGALDPAWGDDGVTGGRALTVTTDELGQIVVAGDFQASEVTPHHDLKVWAYANDGASRWSETWARPDLVYAAKDEQARAALILPSGDILIAGHTSQDIFEAEVIKEALLLRLDPSGEIDDAPWIDSSNSTSELRGITRADKGDIYLVGRATAAAGENPRSTVWRIDEDLETQLWSRPLTGQSPDAAAEGVGLTAAGRVVVGSTKGQRFHLAIAQTAGLGPLLWQESLELAGGPDLLHALALDPYDYIYVAGQATIGKTHRAYARRVSP